MMTGVILEGSDKALFDELMCIADTKMVLAGWYMITLPNGRAISDWASICGMMQDHYGHARALFGYLARYGLTRAEAEWTRPASAIRGPAVLDSPPQSWLDLIVSTFLVEQALITLLSGHEQSEAEPELAALVRKMVKESRYHLSCVRGWLAVLVKSQPDALGTVVAKRMPSIFDWWGPADAGDALFEAGRRTASLTALRQAFFDAVVTVVPATSAVPCDDNVAGWDPTTMRSGSPGIPERLFEIIRFKNIELAMP